MWGLSGLLRRMAATASFAQIIIYLPLTLDVSRMRLLNRKYQN
jgi:hypothetical protein